jgi:magnesium-transporting ATPase (P-type)
MLSVCNGTILWNNVNFSGKGMSLLSMLNFRNFGDENLALGEVFIQVPRIILFIIIIIIIIPRSLRADISLVYNRRYINLAADSVVEKTLSFMNP